MKTFDEVFIDKTKYGVKVQTSEYEEQGEHIIIDQGQNQVAGYTDREEGLFEEVPVVIFGDHTRVIKYVDEPFFLGADGVKVLRSKDENANHKYLYYALKNAKIPNTGYNRHFKWLKEIQINYPDRNKQAEIVDVLDRVSYIILKREAELQTLDELIKARFVEMFDGKYPEDTLLNLCNIIDYRGKTPEKVESGLPFITAKNVKMHHMSLEPREYISEETYDKVMVRGFPKEGDVVFTTEAPLGNVCRIPHFDTKFYIGQRIVTMQTELLNPIYLEYALSDDEFVKKYMGKSSGSTVTGIRVRLLEQLTIPVPPRELQNEFAVFVTQVDKSKVMVQKALDETQLLFDSLMQKYFG